jgi:hypothetical protein
MQRRTGALAAQWRPRGRVPIPVCAHVIDRDRAHRQHRQRARQHRAQRPQDAWRIGLRREQLEPVCAGIEHAERFGGRGEAGQREQSQRLGFDDHRRIGVWHDDQAAARLRNLLDVMRIDDRAGADQGTLAERCGQQLDALQRFGRVERHLDDGEAGIDQRVADLHALERMHPAQDRDQRACGEGIVQIHHLRASGRCGERRQSPRTAASASSATARCPKCSRAWR